ncbi:hypothetical protein A2U01_0035481 [Trifolium medium]|uniref:Uncharacterized protein n=1 Tax=Trifolium medium TaxID=97028 RepID=A0A392PQJ3_9FABA|nr:hypothetical protein [Trifolium medium]
MLAGGRGVVWSAAVAEDGSGFSVDGWFVEVEDCGEWWRFCDGDDLMVVNG